LYWIVLSFAKKGRGEAGIQKGFMILRGGRELYLEICLVLLVKVMAFIANVLSPLDLQSFHQIHGGSPINRRCLTAQLDPSRSSENSRST
jgi:hypothetical protein